MTGRLGARWTMVLLLAVPVTTIVACTATESAETVAPAGPAADQGQGGDGASDAVVVVPADVDGDRPDEASSATATFGRPEPWAVPFLFASDRSGSFEIHANSADGTGHQLTEDPDVDSWWPRLSPDGSTVLLLRSPVGTQPLAGVDANDQHASLWSMSLDGSGLVERIPADEFDRLGPPTWSPDGRHIVFAATDPLDGRWRIWSARTDSFDPRPLTSADRLYLDPSYSPDGSRITYVAYPAGYRGAMDEDHNLEVFTAAADGSDETRITFDETADRGPAWSPDGRWLAFESRTSEPDAFIGLWSLRAYSFDADTTENVLADGNVNTVVRWHPERRGLFFQRYDFDLPGRHLAYVDLDGAEVSTLVAGSIDETSIAIDPVFLPIDLG